MHVAARPEGHSGGGARRGERGQAILLFVGLVTVIFVIAAIVIDFGLWFAERRSVQRAADFAALAGSQDLLSDDNAAVANAFDWAARNDYQDGIDGVEVTVELLCKNTSSGSADGICTNGNPPGSGPSSCQAGSGCDSLRVIIRKPVDRLFTSLFGIDSIAVTAGASAVAGLELDVAAMDTVMLLDTSGTMLASCNRWRDNDGCAIKEARDAANTLVDLLTSGTSGGSRVGYVPYNYCYTPPGNWLCAPEANVIEPTTSAAALHAAIDATSARSLTNTCLPLLRALNMVGGSGASRPTVLFLSDGDNNAYFDYWNGIRVPADCRPSPASSVEFNWPPCRQAWDEEREVDVKTWEMANRVKAAGIEIYVVGLRVCGTDDGRTASDAGYCDGIGDDAHDNLADQRLLKCIASSPDHYYPVPSAEDLTGVFVQIAGTIISRGLLE